MTYRLADFRPQIEAALTYANESHTFEDVARILANDYAQFWAMPSSVVITQVVEQSGTLVLHIWLAGGKLNEIQIMAPFVLEWGRSRGCTAATFTGRKGWLRTFLARDGWTCDPTVEPSDHCIGMRCSLM